MDISALRARLGALVFPSILLIAGSSSALAQQQTPTTYDSSFSIASQRVDPQGHTVIIMQGTGDLPGVLTLVLSLAPDGTVASGEWALNVSYTAPLNPGAAPKPDSPDPDSGVGEQLIQKGTLSGTIASGSTIASNGQITEFTSLQLAISSGTLQFAGVTAGNGAANGTNINDRANSAASTSLTF